MFQTVLLSVLLLPTQPAGRPQPGPARAIDWNLSVQLERSQEFVYRGSFTEECTAGTVQYQRAYRVESRLFVLDLTPKLAELAVMTTLRPKEAPAPGPGQGFGFKDDTENRNIRVERVRVDQQGKLSAEGGLNLVPPMEGPATVEVGGFVELPRGRFLVDSTWETMPKAGEPAMSWTATGADTIQSVRCAVLKGVQQSPDWDQPRGDRKAWRRTDTVWVAPRTGVAMKIERVIEMRDPAHKAPTQKSVFRADLESSLTYPGQLFMDRQADIMQAMAMREAVLPLLATPARFATQLNGLLKRITDHLDKVPPTPYRQAIMLVKSQVEAALRGEVLVMPTTVRAKPEGFAIGELAPDFVTTDISGKQSVGLKQLRGKPVVLAFYNPNSMLAPDILAFLADLNTASRGKVWVMGLSVVEDAAIVQKQLTDLKLTVPVLQGSGLRISYAVETTPRVVIIDAQGYARGAFTGWGREIPREIQAELKPWLSEK